MNANRFRQYAEDCRRMAERAPPDQKPKMLEIAKAWDECATMIENDKKKAGEQEPSLRRSML